MRFPWSGVLCMTLAAFAPLSGAQLSIEITGAGAKRIPVAVMPFPGEAAMPPGLTSIISADLEGSGLFRTLELPPNLPPSNEAAPVNYAEWRSRLADAVVLGSLVAQPDGKFVQRQCLYGG